MVACPAPAAALRGCDVPVQRVEASAFTVPTDTPEGDGTLAWDSTTLVLVEATGGGRSGIGWTYGPAACVAVVRDRLGPVVAGRSALDVQGSYHAMVPALRNDGRPGIAALALSAVDTALWDLKARLLELPLHRLLGSVRDTVPVYGSGGFTTYTDQQLVDQLESWRDVGVPRVKIKVGESHGTRTGRDTARVRLARSTIGPGAELYVDANGGFTAAQAIAWWHQVAEHGVSWFEEPVSSDDLAGLRRVRDAVGADVTAGEYGYDLTYFARMLDAGAVDCLQVDVTRCGGITEWLRVTAVAAAHHIDVSGHCAPHLHVGVAAATPNLRHLEWFHDHVRIERLFFEGAEAEPTDGVLRPCEGPGNGLRVRPRAVEPYRVR
jgi:L-alanine-DL-glutamate epimerase-like enolase superfamily enzyme